MLLQLTTLQQLELSDLPLAEVEDKQLYSALTASSQLSSLAIRCSNSSSSSHWQLAANQGFWGKLQAAFDPGRLLPQLQELHLQPGDCSVGPTHSIGRADRLCAADVERIAACCPGLTALKLDIVVQCNADISSLTSLRSSLQTPGAHSAWGTGQQQQQLRS